MNRRRSWFWAASISAATRSPGLFGPKPLAPPQPPAHAGQRRASGEEYVSHTVEVATILATLRLDSASIIAGLIHDIVEDTALSLSDVETRFGREVATIVDGVTKLGKMHFSSATEQQVENYQKQARIAVETRDIYAPLAHRLGMAGDEVDAALTWLRQVPRSRSCSPRETWPP